MHPRDLVRVSMLVSLGALLVALAVWVLSFGLGGGSGSPFGPLILLGGLAVLGLGVLLLGGAGADALWARLERLRGR